MKDLERLKKEGKIRDYKAMDLKPVTVDVGGRRVLKHFHRKSDEKDWMGLNMLKWCNDKCLALEGEYKFHEERNWRFDWAIPALKVAIEYEGLMSEKSGHTTIKGYTKDTEKYRAAAIKGWTVLRYTALNYKELLNDINQIYEKKMQ